ncbi:serine protease [Lutibacter sp. HS1-25]|uniref:S1 family peptidase n=1 Tax=Lutibacter sp. HS1-25 TaxID=2485000 RepID=UPI001011B33B|nr:serine protease [Lutibacter sp. HS1-25]RXP46575.1 serine protease [Lutibacter sp. HS1-25]
MVIRYILIFVSFIFLSCSSSNVQKASSESNQAVAINHLKYIGAVTQEAQNYITTNNYTPFETLQTQKLDRIEENSEVVVSNFKPKKKSGHEMYSHLQKSTLYIGSSFLCDKCPNIHLNNATGFVIHEDGVIVTNYHVIEVNSQVDISAIFVADFEGNVFPVTNILSASQSNDLAILKVNTNGKKLKALPLAKQELVGEDVFMMGHPFGTTFFMTKGMIANKYMSERSYEPKIAITAEFGQGASGGPVVNEFGQIVGVVSATQIHYTNGSKEHGDLQLIVKEAVPVSALNNYIKTK